MRNQATSIYRQADRFAEITKKAIVTGNIIRAKKFLSFAEQLLTTGSVETKSVICSVYVHSVSTFMEFRNCSIANLFPQKLKAEYLKQVNATSV